MEKVKSHENYSHGVGGHLRPRQALHLIYIKSLIRVIVANQHSQKLLVKIYVVATCRSHNVLKGKTDLNMLNCPFILYTKIHRGVISVRCGNHKSSVGCSNNILSTDPTINKWEHICFVNVILETAVV